MDYGRFAERLMLMDDAAWARHTNPWSLWTRLPILPALVLALHSRAIVGWWCLVPVALLAAWALINPRAFPVPTRERRGSWSTRGVLGERVWLDRKTTPIPQEFERAASLLLWPQVAGVLLIAYGVFVLNGWASFAGVVLALGAKLWFVDRMVWLYDVAGDGRFTPEP